ncbi:hypothetical protein [Victivallis sp. Marseille-Q1083]|uniref:hypothetical protein n=1 Tax=Victivallis sp. Marseille-Q1083 TaxID=2717288 RepID=UPI0015897566|nr:hypothetical protein [Victivallis sp. Marseille-Q1083]
MFFLLIASLTSGCFYNSFGIRLDGNDVYQSMREDKYVLQIPCIVEKDGRYSKLIPLNVDAKYSDDVIILPAGTELSLEGIRLKVDAYYGLAKHLLANDFEVSCYLIGEMNGVPTIFNVDELTLTKGNPAVHVEFDERYCKQVPLESE